MNTTLPLGSAPVQAPRRTTGRRWLAAASAAVLAALPLLTQAQSTALEVWPMTASATPNTPVTGVTASTPTFAGLVSTPVAASVNGPYSTNSGQAFAPATDGSGFTSTLDRTTRYEEFTIMPGTGYSVKVDSLIFTSTERNTSSGRVWVSYSTDGFATATAPSTNEITNIIVPAPITPPATPSFTTPVGLVTAGNSAPIATVNTHTYRATLNGTTGVTVTGSTILRIRLYFAGSSSTNRPVFLRQVVAKGAVTATASPCVNATPAAVSNITFTSARLNFTAGTSTGTSTSISVAPTAGGAAVASASGVSSPYNVTGLPANSTTTQYTVTYTTTCTSGTVNTTTNTFTTPAAPVCNAPTALTIGSLTSTSAQLSFTAGASPSAPATDNTSYTVSISPAVAGSPTSATASPINFSGLTAGTSYTVTLTSNCAGNGGTSTNVTKTFLVPVANSVVLEQWPLTANNAPVTPVQPNMYLAVAPTTPRLHKLVLSNGTTVPSAGVLPAETYSADKGQAIAPSADGLWSTSGTPPGPGGTLTGAFYEEFTVKAADDQSVRVDSVVLTSTFYSSNSNTKLALLYSKNGFIAPSDSLNVVTGFGFYNPATATGTTGPVTASIASPITLVPNFLTTAPPAAPPVPNVYHLALNGAIGVNITPGQTLTFRLYYACGSGSTGRYALLKDVTAKGQSTLTAPICDAPTSLGVTNITATTASLNYTAGGGGGVTYTVKYYPTATPASVTTVTTTATGTTVALTGLTASTAYTATVQANCSLGSLTSSIASTTFTTAATRLATWPLTADDNADGTTNAALIASPSTRKRFVLSDGVTTPVNAPYSTANGVAFAPTANGMWATPVGPSANPNARYYAQFKIAAAAGKSVRIDAINFNSVFVGSPSNKLAISYSRNSYITGTDSTDVSGGGTGPAGALSTTGGFSSPIILTNTTANTDVYRVLLNGATGVTINAGQTLTIRFYYAYSSSTNTGRYALLKNVSVEGTAFTTSPVTDLTITGTQGISGTYNNIIINSPGIATISGPLTVNGSIVVNSGGTLNTNCQTMSGAGSFTLAAGGTLGTCSSSITAASSLTGASTFSGDASYVFNGTAAQTSAGMPATARNLTVANGGNGLTLTQPLGVTKLVRLTNSNMASNGNLTLLSVRGGGTALINNEGTGVVTGTATMQRAVDISTPTNDGYHHFSSPMLTTTINDLATPGFNLVLNPAYNTAAIAGTVRPFPTVYGYDETRVGSTTVATDQLAFNQGFYSPSTGTTAAPVADVMTVGKGYTALVPNALMEDFVGTFNNGPVSITSLTRGSNAESGYHLLGNPYPSPINAATMASALTNMEANVYVWHASSTYGGIYSTYNITTGMGVNGGVATLDAGAGFIMRVSTAPGSVALTNANRATTFGTQPAFGRQANTRSLVSLQVSGAGTTDALTIYADAAATTGVDAQYDAAKLANPSGLNLAALAGTTRLALDALPSITAATVVPLTLTVPTAGTYTLALSQLANVGSTVYLRDAFTGTERLLTAGSPLTVTVTNAPTTRFSLAFRPSGALATTTNVLAAQANVYPNPAHGSFSLLVPAVPGAAKATATLLNALGQVVNTRTLALTAGGATSEYATSGLAAGVYALRVAAGNQVATIRVVVE